MWFEILPAAGAIFTCMTSGFLLANFIPWLVYGKTFCRDLSNNSTVAGWHRDERITGFAYTLSGLECIPDEGAEKSKKQQECLKK